MPAGVQGVEKETVGRRSQHTNNRMEWKGAFVAWKSSATLQVLLVTDSQYVDEGHQ